MTKLKVTPEENSTRWRKAERERLIGARLEPPAEHRAAHTLAITSDLSALIPTAAGAIVSVHWPVKAELDVRPWLQAMWERRARIALPVAIALGQPLAAETSRSLQCLRYIHGT